MSIRDAMLLLVGACGGALTFLLTFIFFAMMTVGKRADEETDRMIEAKRRWEAENKRRWDIWQ
jgi:hypothetical protein